MTRSQKVRSSAPSRPRTSMTNSKTQKNTSKKKESLLNDNECIEMREKNWEQSNLQEYNNDQLQKLFEHCREYASDCATKSDFKSAKRAQQLCEECKAAIVQEIQRSAMNIEDDLTIDSINEKYEDLYKECDDRYNGKLETLKRRHDKEREKFEEEWREDKPIKYRKPSARILQMNAILKNLIEAGEFDRAEALNHQIEKQHQIETQTQQQQLNHDYEEALQKMNKQQQDEVDQVMLYKQKEIDIISAKKQKDITLMENRNSVLRIKRIEAAKKKERAVSAQGTRFSVKEQKNLLLNLKAPNDPEYREEEERKRRDLARRNAQKQKKNTEFLDGYKTLDKQLEEQLEEEERQKKEEEANKKLKQQQKQSKENSPKEEKTEAKKEEDSYSYYSSSSSPRQDEIKHPKTTPVSPKKEKEEKTESKKAKSMPISPKESAREEKDNKTNETKPETTGRQKSQKETPKKEEKEEKEEKSSGEQKTEKKEKKKERKKKENDKSEYEYYSDYSGSYYSDYSENEEKTGNKNTNEDTKIHQQIVKKLSETKETKSDK